MYGSMRVKYLAAVIAGIGIGFQPAAAQKPGASPQPPSAGGGVPGATTGTRSIPTQPRTTMPGPDMMNRGLYLSGKVVLEDGSPPPEPVTIERLCGASPRAQAYTDLKGRFSFQMGQTAGVMQDASESGSGTLYPNAPEARSGPGANGVPTPQRAGSADYRLAGCDLRASLPGYRSDTVNLAGRRIMDNPDVGTIVLHRLANVEGTVISMTSLEAPKEARKAYDKGRQAIQKGKPEEAGAHFQKAVGLYPKYAAAWYELGRIQQQNRNFDQARESYGKALAADGKFMSPYVQLAEIAAAAQNWPELAGATDRVLKLDPVDYPAAYLYNAAANLNLGNLDAAEKSARAGEKIDSEHRFPKIEEVLATVLARKKDYSGAAEHMRAYLQLAAPGQDTEPIKRQIADYERLSGAARQASEPAAKDTPPR